MDPIVKILYWDGGKYVKYVSGCSLHRVDGPALYDWFENPRWQYWANDKFHNVDGYKVIEELGLDMNHERWTETERDMFSLHFMAKIGGVK